MPNVVKVMQRQASPDYVANFWSPRYPGQIPDRLVIAEELSSSEIALEGRELVVVELGHTDTEHTTCLHVPSVGLVVAGDAAYNDIHLYLAESRRAHPIGMDRSARHHRVAQATRRGRRT